MSTSTNEQATQALLSLCQDRRRWSTELTADAVKALLAQGADVNGRGDYDSTPLHFAVLEPPRRTIRSPASTW